MNMLVRAGLLAVCAAIFVTSTAHAALADRPSGIKIGQRMTLRPYVSFSATYDSNPRSRHDDADGDVFWTVSPTLGLSYDAETWSLLLNAYYNYHAYTKSENSDQNRHSYGEDLRWNWSNSTGAEKGWTLVLAESFQQITMADEMSMGGGRGYTADTRQLQASAALQRRFTEHLHADINVSYYWLDYMNDTSFDSAFYGWQRWTVGAEAGYAFSPWTDLILAGGYQHYTQDNNAGMNLPDDSQGYTVQAGFGSYMTERISYRALVGWTQFSYADGASSRGGPSYTVSGNWKIGETWNTMLLASSYYQPCERQRSSSSRIDSISWGLAKTMVRGKLRATFDVVYRREAIEWGADAPGAGSTDYTLDILTGRLGLDYTLNRFLSVFVNGEYQWSFNDEADAPGRVGAYDYDRWRVTAGFRLSY